MRRGRALLRPDLHYHSKGKGRNWLGIPASDARRSLANNPPNGGRCLNTAQVALVQQGLRLRVGARMCTLGACAANKSEEEEEETAGWGGESCTVTLCRADGFLQPAAAPLRSSHPPPPSPLPPLHPPLLPPPLRPHFIYNQGRRPFDPAAHLQTPTVVFLARRKRLLPSLF